MSTNAKNWDICLTHMVFDRKRLSKRDFRLLISYYQALSDAEKRVALRQMPGRIRRGMESTFGAQTLWH